MSELVLYRKYRPQSFADFVGQEHIVKTITNALAMGRVAHAYLFCGPRGVGKTTIARILAKAANCENRKKDDYEPCNKCLACQEINQGKSLDIIEIDAASHTGVDDIRELRDGIRFSPTRLRYKVFIIDEAHQLSKAAFNALLKTLEEPPEYAIFILATTEIHKVPETIISRCQKFDFHRLSMEKIIERLTEIAKSEGVKIEKPALEMVAMNAEGGMRDAESLLGQIMALQDKNITLGEVKEILGTPDVAAAIEMINFLISKDARGAVIFINKLQDDGYDLAQFAKTLINYLRKMMILKIDSDLAKLVAPEMTEEYKKIILEQGQKISFEDLNKLMRLLINAEYEIKNAALPQLPLELVVVEMIND
jgi:DNA polymerase-3 subunit gamma/tau